MILIARFLITVDKAKHREVQKGSKEKTERLHGALEEERR